MYPCIYTRVCMHVSPFPSLDNAWTGRLFSAKFRKRSRSPWFWSSCKLDENGCPLASLKGQEHWHTGMMLEMGPTFVLLYGEWRGDNSLAAGRDALLSHGCSYKDHPWVRDKCPLIASLFRIFFFSFVHKLKTICKAVCFWYSLFVVLIQGAPMDYKGPSGAGEKRGFP